MILYDKVCSVCGKNFKGTWHQDYCSRKCRSAHQYQKIVKHVCPICQNVFFGKRSKIYCSPKCKRNKKIATDLPVQIPRTKTNGQHISDINRQARALGLSYGKYMAYIQLGLNPADFTKTY